MAPLPAASVDTALSSLELDARSSPIDLPAYLSSLTLSELEAFDHPSNLAKRDPLPISLPLHTSPLTALSHLTPRNPAPAPKDNHSGSINPATINMKGIQALIALIGASFVITAIWFFFWAKNGGFHWHKNDWDDYKSTVLRRKGPDGKTLSNATKSTRLGGGSIVASGYSDQDTMTQTSDDPIMREKARAHKEKPAKKIRVHGLTGGSRKGRQAMKETAKAANIRAAANAAWEGGADHDVRRYRHERVAKVGGLNRDSDTHYYGTDHSQTHSNTHSHSQGSEYGYAAHNPSPQSQPRRQASPEKRTSTTPGRRDFSYQRGDDNSPRHGYHSPSRPNSIPNSRPSMSVPGSWAEPLNFEGDGARGTKSYAHPIPGLAKGFRAGNGRGGRRDSLDDSD